MTSTQQRFVYWLPPADFQESRARLRDRGYTVVEALLTPCQVLRARGRTLVYASPGKWNGVCNRQGSWYRHSRRAGQYLLVSDHELIGAMAEFLDARLSLSDFAPEALPTDEALRDLVASPEYRREQPPGWERITWRDSLLFKSLFSVTRFWRRGDSLRTRWLEQRSNHANFLARRYTTTIDGETVPYSVTGNAGVCSSCAEFFNVVKPGDRKLVRSCPGSITFAGAARDAYYDVRPVALSVSAAAGAGR